MPRPPQPLSELEAFVLGLIWQFGPCSPYDVRVHMKRSPSTQWSASSGAIYPLVNKLLARKLVGLRADNAGPRGKRTYHATAAGTTALRAWIGPPLAPQAISVTHDPLRTRVRFLAALPLADRAGWVADALRALDEVERHVRQWQQTYAPTGPFAQLLTRNAELELAARRQWITEVGQALHAQSHPRARPPKPRPR